ncbi:Uncharacterized protein APZ42_002097, partial [Daphnia magna]
LEETSTKATIAIEETIVEKAAPSLFHSIGAEPTEWVMELAIIQTASSSPLPTTSLKFITIEMPKSSTCAPKRSQFRPMLFLDKIEPLTKTNKLCSGYVNRAQEILKQQHPIIGGLNCVLVAKGFVQPEHVNLYDGLAGSAWHDKHVLSCMSSLLKTGEKKMTYIVKQCQRQNNSYDCGVFAIAFATSLANGEDPTGMLYDPNQLRPHLNECMTSGKLTSFPSTISRRKRSPETEKTEEVFCNCRRTAYQLPSKQWEYIECDQ